MLGIQGDVSAFAEIRNNVSAIKDGIEKRGGVNLNLRF